jgi:(1->4)-alpha-D-glucan 1-alpha-D-glucosylmutase
MTQRRAFGSTYRLQLNGVGFATAADVVPFLNDLGVQTLYVSPISRARAGSSHGYDIVDPTVLDPALGTTEDYEGLLDVLGAHDMTLLIDIVPNHMAATAENPYFADVLRHGQASQFAAYFDIDWDEQDGKVMLAVLGGPLDDVVAAGELQVILDKPVLGPALGYFDHRFPLDPNSFDPAAPVTKLLDLQHYRLADWRVANRELNYRRFFDINELIGVRQEDPAVFEATHQLIRDLVRDPRVAGVRVDHVDGLRDPAAYLERLRAALPSDGGEPVIEVEKILEYDEPLPAWAVDGTTGYEFAAAVTGLFVEPDGARQIADAYATATGDPRSFAERAVQAKRAVLASLFEHQLDIVASRIDGVIDRGATAAVAELTAQLAVYRTYRRPGIPVTIGDSRRIETAAQLARPNLTSGDSETVDAVVALLTGDVEPGSPTADAVAAWQQLTSPATAKGVEDTALYDPGRLLAAADVGTDPDHTAISAAEFHARIRTRQERTPLAQSTLSTHDSKRSHDVRCRLAVLSEIPERWEAAVAALDEAVPAQSRDQIDAAERRYVYETLVGAWPLDGHVTQRFMDRLDEHVVKAAREAKRHSSWTAPDSAYEDRIRGFVRTLLAEESDDRRNLVGTVVRASARAGATNSFASVVVRAVAPGVPDVYQGDDAWLFALVDPDNRAPFDVGTHRALLHRLPSETEPLSDELVTNLVENWRDGRIKQLVTRASLQLRRRLGDFFTTATYEALDVTGSHAEDLVGFVRRGTDRTVVCVVPVRPYAVAGGNFPVGAERWGDTVVALPTDGTPYTDVITGDQIAVPAAGVTAGELFRRLPVCLLES